ncbi:MAG: diphthamide biosynthesis enzyme Dph2 [Candidatus Thermoplasmatota archaeon]|nr:diphthamide biosynthesis enzyme Dph2 [Candidatus Thermoplasmatota archaeon]
MNINGYTIAIEPILKTIKKKGYKYIALQLPEGLKPTALIISKMIEKETSAETYILADPCFGACDIPIDHLSTLHLDLIIHIGHEPIPSIPTPTTPIAYLPASATIKLTPIINKVAPMLENKRVAVFTTTQHLSELKNIYQILSTKNVTLVTTQPSSRSHHTGHILGCDFTAATQLKDQVDIFLYIGSGFFHPLGIKLATHKPVIAADPYSLKIEHEYLDQQKDAILRQRYGAIALAKESQRFGILLTTKPGQQRLTLAHTIKTMLIKAQKKAYLFIIDRITPDYLLGFRTIDCFVSTACPRIALDDYQLYKKPLLTPIEVEIVLGKRPWESYSFDQIIDTDTTIK